MAEANNGRGKAVELPQDRKAAVEAGLAHFQLVSAERDSLQRQLHDMRSEMAALKVVAEAQKSQMTEMESRNATMLAIRDQAVAERAKYETLFMSFQAMLRTFNIPAAPLVKEMNTNENDPSDHDDYVAVEHERER